ncbi:Spy/CpxP family protein refolding chaperone [Methylocystis suflitae]|uniref:Spy/CpxP family protein refolding chaperone n=1 Tax=Methylocystis suflitae TaxID=2951405 RepID=UPI00210D8C47|nr:Spy/CpxP family protein refolding chaperone [Methylocystis suflitae]MCQ4189464.1 Spy/CpxP family protein refolding chaperone [Methylocystis suflitae]
MTTRKQTSRGKLLAASAAALLLAAGLSMAQAQQGGMDHSKMDGAMDHGGANAPAQWADPGKAQAGGAESGKTDVQKSEAGKGDEGHAGHHGMSGMGQGGGQSGGMGGMMGGMSGMGQGGGQSGGMGGGMMGGMSGMGHGGGKDGGKGGDGMSGMSHAAGGMMNKMVCGFADHLEGRLAYLRAELKLTDAQTGPWNAFAEAWRAAGQKAKQKCDAADMRADHSKPEVLNKLTMMENHMVDHLEVVRAQKAAIESLFTSLSEDQKKTANETLTGIMKVGKSMGDMMGGGMMGGGMSHSGGGMGGMGGMQH